MTKPPAAAFATRSVFWDIRLLVDHSAEIVIPMVQRRGLTSVAGTLLNLAGFRNRSRHGRSMESGPEDCGA